MSARLSLPVVFKGRSDLFVYNTNESAKDPAFCSVVVAMTFALLNPTSGTLFLPAMAVGSKGPCHTFFWYLRRGVALQPDHILCRNSTLWISFPRSFKSAQRTMFDGDNLFSSFTLSLIFFCTAVSSPRGASHSFTCVQKRQPRTPDARTGSSSSCTENSTTSSLLSASQPSILSFGLEPSPVHTGSVVLSAVYVTLTALLPASLTKAAAAETSARPLTGP